MRPVNGRGQRAARDGQIQTQNAQESEHRGTHGGRWAEREEAGSLGQTGAEVHGASGGTMHLPEPARLSRFGPSSRKHRFRRRRTRLWVVQKRLKSFSMRCPICDTFT
jgi:hypothetical protein